MFQFPPLATPRSPGTPLAISSTGPVLDMYRRGRSSFRSTSKRRRSATPARKSKFVKTENRTLSIPRRMQGYPDKITVTLKYATTISKTMTSGAFTYHDFNGNSVYDPDLTGGGHQPYGYDQWAAMYQRYCVHSASMKVQGVTDGAAVQLAVEAASGTNYVPANFSFAAERPRTVSGVAVAGIPLRLYNKGDTETFGCIPVAQQLTDDRLCGNTGSSFSAGNPVNQWFFRCWMQPIDGATTTVLYLNVQMTFRVTFFQRIQVDAS